MRILQLGATGYVGSRVREALRSRGHEVVAALRHESRASALPFGVATVVAPMAEPDRVLDEARKVDAIVLTAFPGHGTAWPDAVALEGRLHETLAEGLRGSGKVVVMSNGTIFLGDSGGLALAEDAEVLADHPATARAANANRLMQPSLGLRTVELRLASFVYGYGGSVFVPVLVAHAKRTGRSLRVAQGRALLSAVHVEDASLAYVAAVESSSARGVYHVAADECPTAGALAEAVARNTGARVVDVDAETAAHELDPFTAMFLATNNRLRSDRARVELGWQPVVGAGLLWDVAHGSYATR